MGTSNRVAVASGILVAGAVLWWALRPDASPPAPVGTVDGGKAPTPREIATPVSRGPEPGPGTIGVVPSPGKAAGPPRGEPAKPASPAAPRAVPVEDLPPDTRAGPGDVVGRVLLLPGSTPVAGAKVRLLGGRPGHDVPPFPRVSSATTGPSGVFRIRGFAPGEYLFEVLIEGRLPHRFRASLAPGSGADGIEVLFGTGGGIEGTVAVASGAAAGGLEVLAEGTEGRGSVRTRVGAEGAYRFEDILPGYFTVSVLPGRGSLRRRSAGVTVAEGKMARLDFPAGAALAGTLLDGEGAPVPGAIVRASRTEGAWAGSQATTDTAGRWRIEDLEPGEWKVGVQVLGERGFSAEVATATVAPGENVLDIRLDRGDLAGAIAGRVTSKATGKGLSSMAPQEVQISLHALVEKEEGAWGLGPYVATAFADAEGNYRFRSLRAGRYRLLLHSFTGHRGRETDVEMRPGGVKEGMDFALEPAERRPAPTGASVLVGTVKGESGRPLSRALVYALAQPSGRPMLSASTDDAGQYRIPGLDPGVWKVQVQVLGADGFVADAGDVAVVPGENRFPVELGKGDLSGGIAGRVLARGSRRPLSRVEATLSLLGFGPDGKGGWGPGRSSGLAFPDEEGGFRFPSVKGGRYRIVASPRGGGLRTAERDVDLAPGEQAKGVEILMEEVRTGMVRWVLRDEEGKPVDRAKIQTVREDGVADPADRFCNSDSGVYELFYEVGPRRLRISDLGDRLSAETAVEVREGETLKVEVVLRPKR